MHVTLIVVLAIVGCIGIGISAYLNMKDDDSRDKKSEKLERRIEILEEEVRKLNNILEMTERINVKEKENE